jgi:uncharacterized membrane protein YqjE
MIEDRQTVRSIPERVGDAFEQLSELVRSEIRLARAEVSEKAGQAAVGMGLLFGGLMVLLPALVLLLIALAIFLIDLGLSPIAAHVLSGCLAAVASMGLILAGLSRLKPSSLSPDVTIRQVQKDVAAAKEAVR